MKAKTILVAAALVTYNPIVFAQTTDKEAETDSLDKEMIQEAIRILSDTISGQKGRITIEGGSNAYIDVNDGYVFLAPQEAKHLLVDYWGNEDDPEVLGVLTSDTARIYYNVETAFVIKYDDCGYIKDNDAENINYDDVLSSMKDDCEEYNKIAEKRGTSKCDIVGWAANPRYDNENKTLYWAKHMKFIRPDKSENDILNYDMRVLGRKGFISLMAVAEIDKLQSIEEMKSKILSNVHFNEGYTYNDFNPAKDKIAEWTIGSLIAGKLLLKAGILAKLGVVFAKFWKVILIAFAALCALLSKIFRKRKEEETLTKED